MHHHPSCPLYFAQVYCRNASFTACPPSLISIWPSHCNLMHCPILGSCCATEGDYWLYSRLLLLLLYWTREMSSAAVVAWCVRVATRPVTQSPHLLEPMGGNYYNLNIQFATSCNLLLIGCRQNCFCAPTLISSHRRSADLRWNFKCVSRDAIWSWNAHGHKGSVPLEVECPNCIFPRWKANCYENWTTITTVEYCCPAEESFLLLLLLPINVAISPVPHDKCPNNIHIL